MCLDLPGVGETRSARRHAAGPNPLGHAPMEPITPEIAQAVEARRDLFPTASTMPRIVDDRLRRSPARLAIPGPAGTPEHLARAEAARPPPLVDVADRPAIASPGRL